MQEKNNKIKSEIDELLGKQGVLSKNEEEFRDFFQDQFPKILDRLIQTAVDEASREAIYQTQVAYLISVGRETKCRFIRSRGQQWLNPDKNSHCKFDIKNCLTCDKYQPVNSFWRISWMGK